MAGGGNGGRYFARHAVFALQLFQQIGGGHGTVFVNFGSETAGGFFFGSGTVFVVVTVFTVSVFLYVVFNGKVEQVLLVASVQEYSNVETERAATQNFICFIVSL